jgi:cytochrome P450
MKVATGTMEHGRTTLEDDQCKDARSIVSPILEGVIISVIIYPIHHDPSVWPEPENFLPGKYFSINNHRYYY